MRVLAGLQTISFLAYLKDVLHVSGPYIVVVPLSVLTNWCNEFRTWCPTMRVIKLHSSSREERERVKRDVLNDFHSYDVIVTTYEMVTSSNMKAVLTSKLWCVCAGRGTRLTPQRQRAQVARGGDRRGASHQERRDWPEPGDARDERPVPPAPVGDAAAEQPPRAVGHAQLPGPRALRIQHRVRLLLRPRQGQGGSGGAVCGGRD
jgi:hypothetical protein